MSIFSTLDCIISSQVEVERISLAFFKFKPSNWANGVWNDDKQNELYKTLISIIDETCLNSTELWDKMKINSKV